MRPPLGGLLLLAASPAHRTSTGRDNPLKTWREGRRGRHAILAAGLTSGCRHHCLRKLTLAEPPVMPSPKRTLPEKANV
jgi:hypothetical protein